MMTIAPQASTEDLAGEPQADTSSRIRSGIERAAESLDRYRASLPPPPPPPPPLHSPLHSTAPPPRPPAPPPDASPAAADCATDESDIVAALRAGDRRGAIATCARAIGPALVRLCFALLGVQAEADEATQETLLAAYDGAMSFRGDGTVRAWLYGTARKICARRIEVRARQARRRTLMVDEGVTPAVDAVYERARRGAEVRAALAELRPSEREAVLLRYEGELTCREVALACGIGEAAARKRIGRALARLRERLVK